MRVMCRQCGARWDMDFDPPACHCEDEQDVWDIDDSIQSKTE